MVWIFAVCTLNSRKDIRVLGYLEKGVPLASPSHCHPYPLPSLSTRLRYHCNHVNTLKGIIIRTSFISLKSGEAKVKPRSSRLQD